VVHADVHTEVLLTLHLSVLESEFEGSLSDGLEPEEFLGPLVLVVLLLSSVDLNESLRVGLDLNVRVQHLVLDHLALVRNDWPVDDLRKLLSPVFASLVPLEQRPLLSLGLSGKLDL